MILPAPVAEVGVKTIDAPFRVASFALNATVITPLAPTVTEATFSPVMVFATAKPAAELVAGHAPSLMNVSDTACLAAAAMEIASPAFARTV